MATAPDERDAADPLRLFRVEQIAERLQVSVRTVRRWIAEGALPVVQLGRAVRVRPADLLRLIKTGVPK
jgi:excisionase family DNA binding protein